MRKSRKQRTWPVVPLRDMVVFPGARVPFVVGRLASVEAVRTAVESDGEVLLVMQRDPELREPAPRDLHAVGTLARIVAETKLSDGNYKLVVGQCSGADAKVKVDRDAPIDQGPLFMSFKPEQACVYVNEQLVT